MMTNKTSFTRRADETAADFAERVACEMFEGDAVEFVESGAYLCSHCASYGDDESIQTAEIDRDSGNCNNCKGF